MAKKVNLKNVENVEGEYHLMFFEGKNILEKTKSDISFACLAMLFFVAFIAIFVLVTGLNFYYLYFLAIFAVIFVLAMLLYAYQRHVGKKQCRTAVLKSNPSDVIPKEMNVKDKSRVIVKSMSSTIDKYDAKEKFPGVVKKYKRLRKHRDIANSIKEFEEE